MTQTEINHKHFVDMLPFMMLGSFTNQVKDVKKLNEELANQLLTSKSGTSNKSHKGVSLGKTVVSGGVYGDKKKGISGSIHWNSMQKCETSERCFSTGRISNQRGIWRQAMVQEMDEIL
jgi:hypothetical protein